jgi:predicted porin
MFDKNTNMYVRYENYDLNTNGTTVGGSTTSGFAVGVKYVF